MKNVRNRDEVTFVVAVMKVASCGSKKLALGHTKTQSLLTWTCTVKG